MNPFFNQREILLFQTCILCSGQIFHQKKEKTEKNFIFYLFFLVNALYYKRIQN